MTRILLGLVGMHLVIVGFCTAAHAEDRFRRPDCSAYKQTYKAESRCFREIGRDWRQSNYDAVQKAGLEFVYMARPDLGTSPGAQKALGGKVEGSYTIEYSVGTDGKVYDVKIADVTSDAIAPIATLWADTIKQWTFVKIAKPVVGLKYRRIYLYSKDDEDQEAKKRHDND